MRDPIIVTGVPRSRTSMTCGILNTLGAFGGVMRGPNSNNPKGMFENRAIVEMVKGYLKFLECDPMAQKPLPRKDQIVRWPSLRNSIEDVMFSEGYREGPWFFKTVKGCHIWEVFHRAFPEALWVIVRRNEDGLVNSLQRTSFMKAYKTDEGWREYIGYHYDRFSEIKQHCNWLEVDTDELVRGDLGSLEKVVRAAGLHWDQRLARRFISPELTRV